MKKLSIAIIALIVLVSSAQAQVRWGINLGTEISSLHFSKQGFNDITNSQNRAGFTGGVTAEVSLPLTGLCVGGSVMYVHRVDAVKSGNITTTGSRDYLEVPLNLKYKFGIVGVGNIICPYIFTGPSFAFRLSKKDSSVLQDTYHRDMVWNMGLGVQLLNHLQVGASYGFPMKKAADNGSESTKASNKLWTVSTAYLF